MITARRDARRLPFPPRAWRLAVIALAASCGGTITSADQTTPDVAEVVVAPQTATVIVGNTLPLQATVRDASGQALTGPTVVWSVRDPSIATVSATGVLTARAVGSTEIAASSNGRSGLASVTVTPAPVASISLQPASVTLRRNVAATLTPTLKDASGNVLTGRTITWQSSDSTIARVSSAGVVTTLKLGAAVITATSEGKSASAAVTVGTGPVDRIVITPSSVDNLRDGHSAQLSATALDANGDAIAGAVFAWHSNSTYVATVDPTGRVTGEHSGTTSITASFSGKTGSVSVRVR
jgi:trimeric autotransporter adhesin